MNATLTRLTQFALAASAVAVLSGCGSTMPSMGGNKGVVSGSAGGSTTEGNNSQLEKCAETLGTVAIDEDSQAPWYYELRRNSLGSTVPVLRLMIQQSNCFVIVERGRSMNNMMRERQLESSGEMRQGSNFQKGQMVAADYTMQPSIQFSGRTGGAAAGLLTGRLAPLSVVAGSVKRNEAATTLLLIDNRSSVQIAAAEGSAGNFDFGLFGGGFLAGLAGGGGGYSNTPQGKVIVAAFADSFNQMVKSLRNYKAQTVKGGLGTGGRLGVDGGSTPASKELNKK
ncbi:CsgG/HfaB family protein [Piscinibacter sp. HJYY11]|uniref:CsgG/HfaB family protein n=1 Tax=Piscinibacter sp. HJYY11 TaxID=2801333 RepID=UPI00191FB4AE|nr:CsgG/HfaB family protein [Piscinibacter sp. HJYY11]MBL0727751.1 peptidoglycan-binding protein [Piscinibacter sp. HJYY11]